MKRAQTPSQTVGPFFAFGLTPRQYGYAFADVLPRKREARGEKITIEGQVLDGEGKPIVDALLELWPAEGEFARQGTGAVSDASFRFATVKPAGRAGVAPYIDVILFMRGLLSHLNTRIYFDDEAEANDKDALLSSVAPERRATLLARRLDKGVYRFDIHMQGERETVFFDL